MDNKLLQDKNNKCLSIKDLEKVSGGLDVGYSQKLEITDDLNKDMPKINEPVWNYGRVSE